MDIFRSLSATLLALIIIQKDSYVLRGDHLILREGLANFVGKDYIFSA